MSNLSPGKTKPKKYWFYHCRDCVVDFLVGNLDRDRHVRAGKRICCPVCADGLYVEKVTFMWMERPFRYKGRWLDEEEDTIRTGKARGYTIRQIAELLPNRTYEAVRTHWQDMRKREAEANGN